MGGRKFALKGHLTWSWKNGAVRSYGTSVACRPDRDSPRPSSTDEGQLETATRLALWAETSEPMSNWGGASSNTETWLPFWTADPLECAPALMCIHDCREKRGKARLWENPNTHWLTHTHYRVVNPRFDGLTLSYCCEGGKKNKRRVTLLITLTSPLRPEEEEEEDQCITKKKTWGVLSASLPSSILWVKAATWRNKWLGNFPDRLAILYYIWHFPIFS